MKAIFLKAYTAYDNEKEVNLSLEINGVETVFTVNPNKFKCIISTDRYSGGYEETGKLRYYFSEVIDCLDHTYSCILSEGTLIDLQLDSDGILNDIKVIGLEPKISSVDRFIEKEDGVYNLYQFGQLTHSFDTLKEAKQYLCRVVDDFYVF